MRPENWRKSKPELLLRKNPLEKYPEENFEIVNKFLDNNPNFKLVNAAETFPKELIDENGCIQTLPHIHHMDGAFAAKFLRVE